MKKADPVTRVGLVVWRKALPETRSNRALIAKPARSMRARLLVLTHRCLMVPGRRVDDRKVGDGVWLGTRGAGTRPDGERDDRGRLPLFCPVHVGLS